VAQAHAQFEWWTGQRPAERVMRDAALARLKATDVSAIARSAAAEGAESASGKATEGAESAKSAEDRR
jgi:hypothetical protein